MQANAFLGKFEQEAKDIEEDDTRVEKTFGCHLTQGQRL